MKAHRSVPFGLLAVLLICVPGTASIQAAAADIVVSSATPSSAEQGSQDLLVTIKGSGFPKNATVRYCRSGTIPEDCSGIDVNSTRTKGTTTIETVIDIAPSEATETRFDILVIEPLSGRKGRGTGLFKVIKTNSTVNQPPDPVSIETVDAISNAVTLQWHVPSHPNSGHAVLRYDIRYGLSPISEANFANTTVAERSDVYTAQSAGSVDYFTVRELLPERTYYFAVKSVDDDGVASVLGPGSTASAFTARAAPPSVPGNWTTNTIQVYDELAANADVCCAQERIDVDGQGFPAVLFGANGVMRYAWQGSNGWEQEIAWDNVVRDDISALQHVPAGGSYTQIGGTPSFAASTNVVVGFKKGVSVQDVLKYYVYRDDGGTWRQEVIRRSPWTGAGSLGVGNAHAYFYDTVAGTSVAAVGYIDFPQIINQQGVSRIVVSERQLVSGAWRWIESPMLDCSSNPTTSLGIVLMRADDYGQLHILGVATTDRINLWAVVGRRLPSGTWQLYRSGLIRGLRDLRLAIDVDGSMAIAAAMTPTEILNGSSDVIVIDDSSLYELPTPASACQPPGSSEPAVFDVIDSYRAGTTFANGPDGSTIDSLMWGSVIKIDFEFRGLGVPSALHVFAERDDGNHTLREQRVLSRCGGPGTPWLRDAVDRAHADGYVPAMYVQGPVPGIAWAYHYGRAAGGRYLARSLDRMMVTQRQGTACTPAQ